MGRIRHKRKNNHVVIVTSDAVDAQVKQYRIKPWVLQLVIWILCIIIGAMIGYIIYEKDIWAASLSQVSKLHDELGVAQQEHQALDQQINDLKEELYAAEQAQLDEVKELNDTIGAKEEEIRFLSDSLAQKTLLASALQAELDSHFLPTDFPLTGSATMEEVTGDVPMCIFASTGGAMVVATAEGTVIAVNADAEYGQNVWVDHGNGYVTIYRNAGEIKVKQGETVTQGATLFLIEDGENKLGYQMMKDGVYINPMDMLAING